MTSIFVRYLCAEIENGCNFVAKTAADLIKMKDIVNRAARYLVGAAPLWLLYTMLMGLPCALVWDDGNFHFGTVKMTVGMLTALLPAALFTALSCRRWAKVLIASMLWTLFVVDLWCFQVLGTRITERVLDSLLQTNLSEATEFVDNYLTYKPILITAAICATVTLIYWLAKRLWLRREHRINTLAVWILLAVNGLSAVAIYVGHFSEVCGWLFTYTPLERMAIAVTESVGRMDRVHELEEATDRLTVSEYMAGNAPRYVIVVIGESFNPWHSPLYGYPLNTTPNLKREYNGGNLLVFNDVTTPFATTAEMMEVLLSSAPAKVNKGGRASMAYPLWLTLFRNAGYGVGFHSNQNTRMIAEVRMDASCLYFLNSAKVARASLDYRNDRLHAYDGPFLKAETDSLFKQARGHRHWLSVVQLMGQHIDASKRYPVGAEKFGVSDYDYRKELTEKQKQEVAAYDNATAYNDSVVTALMHAVAGEDAVVIYLSDHGEEVHDYRNHYGRTFEAMTLGIERNIYRVPVFVYTTPEFRRRHEDAYGALRGASVHPFTTAGLGELMVGAFLSPR